MKRLLMQIYTKNRTEAFEFYKKAFTAELGWCDKDENGNIIHAELDICGQSIKTGSERQGLLCRSFQSWQLWPSSIL